MGRVRRSGHRLRYGDKGAPAARRCGGVLLPLPAYSAAVKKVGGFAKAIAGKYSDFKKWYDALPWYAKAPLAAVSPGLTLLDIYNALH